MKKVKPQATVYSKRFKMPLTSSWTYCKGGVAVKKRRIILYATENGRITTQQLEALRKVVMRRLQRQGRLRFCVFPHHPVTLKGAGVRMGRGKGKVNHWVVLVQQGAWLVELLSDTPLRAQFALLAGTKKLAIQAGILLL